MREKIKTQKGFIHIPSLIGIIVSIVVIVMIIGYKATSNQKPTITTTVTVTAPSISTTTTELSTTTSTTTTTTTGGSLNTKNTVQEEKTIASSYDYSKLSNKYRNRALYVNCVPKTIRSHEYLDPLLKDLESSDEDKKINALLQLNGDSNLISSETVTKYRNNYQINPKLKSILIEWANFSAKSLEVLYAFETPNYLIMRASGFLLTDKVFLTANHVNTGIISLSQQFQQAENDLLAQYTNSPDFRGENYINFLLDFQISCYVQLFNSSSKYLIKLPFTELGSDIAIGYSDQPIPTDNLQSFSLCKEPPKIGSSVYTPSYPGGEFLESFGKILNKTSQFKLTTGETVTTVTGNIYITDMDSIPGSSGGGVIVYTNNNDCVFGVIFSGNNPDNKLFSGKAETYATSILLYMDKIKAIMQE